MMSEPFLGQITMFPYSFPPRDWADCQGQLVPISQYSALFSLLGTRFGGDGKVTFALPDLQGRVAVGQGAPPGRANYDMGETGGAETVAITTESMPSHGHSLNATQTPGTVNTPAGNLLSTVFVGDFGVGSEGDVYNPSAPTTTLMPKAIAPAGGQMPHDNLQPFLTLRYCISMAGIYPQRS